jgi:hypothetical protein
LEKSLCGNSDGGSKISSVMWFITVEGGFPLVGFLRMAYKIIIFMGRIH